MAARIRHRWRIVFGVTGVILPVVLIYFYGSYTSTPDWVPAITTGHIKNAGLVHPAGAELVPTGVLAVEDPDISPDGNLIAYAALVDYHEEDFGMFADRYLKTKGIFVYDRLSGETRRLTPDSLFSSQPRFSPEGDRLIFAARVIEAVSDTGVEFGSSRILMADLTDTSMVELPTTSASVSSPGFHPDGDAFIYRYGSRGFIISDLGGTTFQDIYHDTFFLKRNYWPPEVDDPDFSPEGRLLLFSGGYRTRSIYICEVGSPVPYPIVEEEIGIQAFDLCGNGRWICFCTEGFGWVVPSGLLLASLDSRETYKISSGGCRFESARMADDGKTMVACARPADGPDRETSLLVLTLPDWVAARTAGERN